MTGTEPASTNLINARSRPLEWCLILSPRDLGLTLLAAIGDVAHPIWRARAVGVYRLWRDGGFAAGALLAGLIADLWGLTTAVWVVAALTAGPGLVVAARMYETRSRAGTGP
jgi:hypothetical protein